MKKNQNYTIKELINDSIQITPGMIAIWPSENNREEPIPVNVTADLEHCFYTNNGTLAYIAKNTLYVTRTTKKAFTALAESNFNQKSFYVPFSNGDLPKGEINKWNQIKKLQQEEGENDFIQDCLDYSDTNGIGELDLSNCMEIPEYGLEVESCAFTKATTYYPIFAGKFFQASCTRERIGTYCYNNGTVCFIYRDGRTFLSYGYKIISELEQAGYKKQEFFVPLSNGEKLTNLHWASVWGTIKSA